MKESEIEKAVCDYAKQRGFNCFKFVSPGTRGVPDRLLTHCTGLVFFMEFKKPGETPRPDQIRAIAKLIDHQVPVFVVDNIELGKEILDDIADTKPTTPLPKTLN